MNSCPVHTGQKWWCVCVKYGFPVHETDGKKLKTPRQTGKRWHGRNSRTRDKKISPTFEPKAATNKRWRSYFCSSFRRPWPLPRPWKCPTWPLRPNSTFKAAGKRSRAKGRAFQTTSTLWVRLRDKISGYERVSSFFQCPNKWKLSSKKVTL